MVTSFPTPTLPCQIMKTLEFMKAELGKGGWEAERSRVQSGPGLGRPWPALNLFL